ncbi:MAG TPA: type II toxin-antitoxin system HicB family antitoxin [Candidatus Aminicenantes bacterium]|nr:type II toxin-antitoxin system HicB family antitoxin [Acidobacteriota bacterium]HOI45573.1 type II toxin-antitoxin system HicB family antitoxin [Candidatus Aminicenantes bacterium]
MKNYKFSVVVEKERMGFYAACPALPGCYSRGKTLEEALRSIREAIKVHLEDRMSDDEEIPQPEPVSFTRLDVSF